MRKFCVLAAAAAAIVAASPAAAQQVTNGSFETGDFSGWSVANGNATYVEPAGFDSYPAQQGAYFAALGNVNAVATISQTLATAAGQAYTLSYYLASNGSSSYFNASWNGHIITGSELNTPAAQPYTLYQFTVTGTGSDTLAFNEQDNPSYLALDNVSLAVAGAVPEPATWAMMLLGFGAIGFAMRRRQSQALAQLA